MARLPSITSKEQLPAADQGIAEAVIKSRGGIHGPFTMLLHAPKLAEHLVNTGAYVRFEGKLLWDNVKGEITNNKEANKLVRPLFRKGWEVRL